MLRRLAGLLFVRLQGDRTPCVEVTSTAAFPDANQMVLCGGLHEDWAGP